MREIFIKLLGGYTNNEVESVVHQLTSKPPVVHGFRHHLINTNKQ